MMLAGPQPKPPFPVIGRVQVRDGHQRGEQEDAADDERADDREEHGLGRGPARVAGLLGQGGRGVEAVDHEQRHEHGDQERARPDVQPAAVGHDVEALVVVEGHQDDREHEHAEDLEQHAGVVDDRDQPDAVDVQHGDHHERDQRDHQLGVQDVSTFPAPRPCQPRPFSAGISASGKVATTAVTVRMPANR